MKILTTCTLIFSCILFLQVIQVKILCSTQTRSQRGCDAPPQICIRSTFNYKSQKWGVCRRVKGSEVEVTFWVQKVHFFGFLPLPKADPGYGPGTTNWIHNRLSKCYHLLHTFRFSQQLQRSHKA